MNRIERILIRISLAVLCVCFGGYLGSLTVEPVIVERVEYVDRPVYLEKIVPVEKTVYVEVEKKVGVPVPISPRPFRSVEELEEWLESYKVNIRHWGRVDFTEGPHCGDFAYAMMITAIEQGYLISTELIEGEGHLVCSTRIGNELYFIEPQRPFKIFQELGGSRWKLL